MKNILKKTYILSFICIVSCTKRQIIDKNENIRVNWFGKGCTDSSFHYIKVNYKFLNKNKAFTYIYKGFTDNPKPDILKIDSLDNVYFNDKKLDFVDREMIKLKDTIINVEKYENYNTYNLFDLRYFYLNKDSGLILEEFLDKENITVYDIKRFNKIHNIILRDSLLFKESDSILKMKKWLKKVNSTRKYTHQTPSR